MFTGVTACSKGTASRVLECSDIIVILGGLRVFFSDISIDGCSVYLEIETDRFVRIFLSFVLSSCFDELRERRKSSLPYIFLEGWSDRNRKMPELLEESDYVINNKIMFKLQIEGDDVY